MYITHYLYTYLIDILPKVLTYAQDEWKHIFALKIVSKHEFHGFAKAVHTNPINYTPGWFVWGECLFYEVNDPLLQVCYKP